MLWTWWDFDQSGEENQTSDVVAYINGVIRCPGHSTTHIIDYKIDKNKIYGSRSSVTIYVNMKLGPSGRRSSHWNGGAPCTHRIWAGKNGGTSGFYNATPEHRGEKGGTCGGGATFRVVIDTNKGELRIS
jgi:hypothetical protein